MEWKGREEKGRNGERTGEEKRSGYGSEKKKEKKGKEDKVMYWNGNESYCKIYILLLRL